MRSFAKIFSLAERFFCNDPRRLAGARSARPHKFMWYVGTTPEKLGVSKIVLKGALDNKFSASPNRGRMPRSVDIRRAEKMADDAARMQAENIRHAAEVKAQVLAQQAEEKAAAEKAAAADEKAAAIAPFKQLKLSKLKALLESKELSTDGDRDDLIERLVEAARVDKQREQELHLIEGSAVAPSRASTSHAASQSSLVESPFPEAVPAELEMPKAPPHLSKQTCKLIDGADDVLHDCMMRPGGGGKGSLRSQLAQLQKVVSEGRHGGRRSPQGVAALSTWSEASAPIVGLAVALYDFLAEDPKELSFFTGDMLSVLGMPESQTPIDWIWASSPAGIGLVPESHVVLKVIRPVEPAPSESIAVEPDDLATPFATPTQDTPRCAAETSSCNPPSSLASLRKEWKSSWHMHASGNQMYRVPGLE